MAKKTARPMAIEDHWPEGDAHSLAEAKVIQADPKRHAAAVKAAQEMADKKAKEAEAMQGVASAKPNKSDKPSRGGTPWKNGGLKVTKIKMPY